MVIRKNKLNQQQSQIQQQHGSEVAFFECDAGSWRELAVGWLGAARTWLHWIERAVGTEREA
jgi:hypothetical protein